MRKICITKSLQIIIIITICFSCNNKKSKLKLPQNWATPKSEFSILFYHTGECSFCYAVLSDLSISFPEVSIISVTTLKDTNMLNYHFREISYRGLSFIDSSSIFYKKNQKMLNGANLFLINSKDEILESWMDYDQQIKENIKKIIYE